METPYRIQLYIGLYVITDSVGALEGKLNLACKMDKRNTTENALLAHIQHIASFTQISVFKCHFSKPMA